MAAAVQGIDICILVFRDNRWVYELNNVSLEIFPGEMVAVVGPRNSGKSSLIRVLGCLQRPYTGHVLVEGGVVSRLNDPQMAWVATHKFSDSSTKTSTSCRKPPPWRTWRCLSVTPGWMSSTGAAGRGMP